MNLEKTCRKHGVLSESDIRKRKSLQNKSGFELRCIRCINEQSWRKRMDCPIHGELKEEDKKTNGACKKCHRSTANKKRNSNRDWFNAKMAEDRLKNPEKWKKIYKESYQKNLAKEGKNRVAKEIIRMRDLTQEQYEKLFDEQGNKCKICNEPESRKHPSGGIMRLVVDHCHDSSKVRGLLCAKCNLMIGYARDSVDILEMAIIYLNESLK